MSEEWWEGKLKDPMWPDREFGLHFVRIGDSLELLKKGRGMIQFEQFHPLLSYFSCSPITTNSLYNRQY